MPSEKKPFVLDNFTGGQAPDFRGLATLPQWDLLSNVFWEGHLRSRPFTPIYQPIAGANTTLAVTHDEKLAYSNGTNLYIDNMPVALLNGGLRLKSDVSQLRTLFANGGNQIAYWNGVSAVEISGVTGVYALATIHGYTKERICYVSTTDKHTLNYSSLDISDFGTQIIDADSINDAWTDGGSIFNFPYEIIDIIEFKSTILIFTTGAIYTLTPTIGLGLEEEDQDIFFFEVELFQEVDLYSTPPVKTTNTVYYVSKDGIGSIGLDVFNKFSSSATIPMNGTRRTILKETDPLLSILSVDTKRDLIYLTPDSVNKMFVVAPAAESIWFQWDIPVNSLVTINETTYVTLKSDGNIYTLSDNPAPGESIEIRIHSGLLSLDNPVTRKHVRAIYADLATYAEEISYVLDVDNKPVTNKLLNKKKVQTKDYRYTARSGQRGERIKLLAEFTIEGTTYFDAFGIEYLEKPWRRGLTS